jgi:hypothetical protein
VVVALVGILRLSEAVCDLHGGPFATLGLVGGGGDLGGRLVGEFIHAGEDGVGPVGVDEIDKRSEVTAAGS